MPKSPPDPEREPVTPAASPPPAAAGTPGNPLQLTDPRTMRALAHPARMAIWMHLGLDGPATATECAQVAGLSPSACSYHLRTLARYGFVEEDREHAADGRERPWRGKQVALSVSSGTGTPAQRAAAQLLTLSMQASAEEMRDNYRQRESQYPAEWQAALGTNYDVLHATPEELDDLKRRVTELFGEYRRLSPAERPDGAQRVRVIVDLVPWFEPGEVS